MAKESRKKIKTYFQTGDQPTELEFIHVFDSTCNLSGSNALTGSLIISGSTSDNADGSTPNLYVMGDITSSGNILALGDVIARNYIVSSSVTNITTQTLSGSTEFGNTADDTHDFTGHITASGNISASGHVNTNKLVLNNSETGTYIRGNGANQMDLNVYNNQIIALTPNVVALRKPLEVTGDISSTSHVTASGNISASGYLTAQHITASGNISSSGNLIANKLAIGTSTHTRQVDIKGDMAMSGSFFQNYVNGQSGIILEQPTPIVSTLRVDSQTFRIWTNGGERFSVVSSSGYVGIGGGVPEAQLDVTGNINTTSHITASGNISASGTITAQNINMDTDQFFRAGGVAVIKYDSTEGGGRIEIGSANKPLAFINNITASGNISSSGNIYANQCYADQTYRLKDSGGTSRHFIAGPESTSVSNNSIQIGNTNFSDGIEFTSNVSASGNISASGTITAHEFKVKSVFIVNGSSLSHQNSTNFGNHSTFDTHTIIGKTKLDGNVTASGNISASGDLSITGKSFFKGSITASGNISASGDIFANSITLANGTGIAYADEIEGPSLTLDSAGQVRVDSAGSSIIFSRSGVNILNLNPGIHSSNFTGNITASGNISSSGDIYSTNHESIYQASINCLASSTAFWFGPNKVGLNLNTWNFNYGNNTGVLTLAQEHAHAGIIVPYKCKLVGFRAVGSPLAGSSTIELALYHEPAASATFNDTTGAADDALIVSVAAATSTSTDTAENPMLWSKLDATTELIAGDMLYPRIKVSNVAGCNLTFTVLVQRIK